MTQSTSQVLLVEPIAFRSNTDTLEDNAFQHTDKYASPVQTQHRAHLEFQGVLSLLKDCGVEAHTFTDTEECASSDSIFPNNWFSTHADGTLCLYPMMAENRRRERREEIVGFLSERYTNLIDLTNWEQQGKFLESTGSLVLDRVNKIAYACLSKRTDPQLVQEWSERMGYRHVAFAATDPEGNPIYHTNVMMGLGTHSAVVALDCIPDLTQRKKLERSLLETRHEIVPLTFNQVEHFCGNIIELKSQGGKELVVMSTQAFNCFDDQQKRAMMQKTSLHHTDLSTIEYYGGGGIRCMIAELF